VRSTPPLVYLDAPITRRGLAGLEISHPLNEVVRILGRASHRRKGKDPSDEMEILEYSGVTVILKKGKITGLWAEGPYRGATEDGLRVGMKWKELVNRLETYFDDERLVWRIVGWPSLEVTIVSAHSSGSQPTNEFYEVTDPDHASVESIAVTDEPYE
jgi:hypothetical protein